MEPYKKLIQHKEIIILFSLSVLFFWKIIVNNTQMIYSPASDLVSAYSYWRQLHASTVINYGEVPMWNPYIFSGTPYIGDPQKALFYPLNAIYLLFPKNLIFGYMFILDVFLTGLFTYVFARTINLGRYSSLVSAVTFMFSGVVTSRIFAGHLILLDSFIWFPLILLFYELAVRDRKPVYGILAGFSIALIFLSGHTQFAAYGAFASVLYFIVRASIEINKDRNVKNIANFAVILFISFAVFLSLFAIQLLPAIEFSKLINRAGGISFDEAASISLAPQYLITFIIPEFFGSPLNNTYFFSGPLWELCGYAGILPLLLALIGILYIKNNKYKTIFLGLAIFALLFSLGKYTPVFSIFYHYIPGFGIFRAPARLLFVYAFSISILAGFGSTFLEGEVFEKHRLRFSRFTGILISLGILAVILLFLAYLAQPYVISYAQEVMAKKYSSSPTMLAHPLSYWYGFAQVIYSTILQSTAVFVIFFIGSAYLLSLKAKGKIKLNHLQLLMITLILLDLFAFGWKFVETKDPDEVFRLPAAASVIKSDNTRYRVLDLSGSLGQEKASKSGIELIGGYDSSHLRLYQDFLRLSGNSSIPVNPGYNLYLDIPYTYNLNILRLLNTKYILAAGELNTSGLNKVDKQDNISVYEVENTMPRAFIVRNARVIEDKKELFSVLQDRGFNLTGEIVLEKDPKVPITNPGKFKEAKISLYTPNRINFDINMESPGFLVLSEIWHPDWKAYDNGREIEVYKTDYALRSVYLEEGEHKISFEYISDSYNTGKKITVVSLVICILIIIVMRRSDKH